MSGMSGPGYVRIDVIADGRVLATCVDVKRPDAAARFVADEHTTRTDGAHQPVLDGPQRIERCTIRGQPVGLGIVRHRDQMVSIEGRVIEPTQPRPIARDPGSTVWRFSPAEGPLIKVLRSCEVRHLTRQGIRRRRLYRFRTERFNASEPSLNVVLSDHPVEHEVGDLPCGSLWHLRERGMEHPDIYAGPTLATRYREGRPAQINLEARDVEQVGHSCRVGLLARPEFPGRGCGWRRPQPPLGSWSDDRNAPRADSKTVLGLDPGPEMPRKVRMDRLNPPRQLVRRLGGPPRVNAVGYLTPPSPESSHRKVGRCFAIFSEETHPRIFAAGNVIWSPLATFGHRLDPGCVASRPVMQVPIPGAL